MSELAEDELTERRVVSAVRTAIAVGSSLLVLLAPLTASFTYQIRFTAFVALLMALLWLLEALPMGLTALLPLVLFPLAGVQTADKVAAPYANSAVFLFLGGFLVAATVEKCGLHRRIAYNVLRAVGTEPQRIVLAVLLVTAMLSMWISNTATALMLTPIAVALVASLPKGRDTSALAEATLLAVAYGASLGGIGTPIGTPTNLIFFGAAKELFPSAPVVSFAQWMGFGLMYLVLALPICWLLLIRMTGVKRGESIPIEKLGLSKPEVLSRAEKITIALFTTTALLWIFRADIVLGDSLRIPGWSNLFPTPRSIHDATVAIAMAVVAFLLPAGGGRRLLDWSDFQKVPWDVLILFGGGFALADSMESSGFAKWTGAQLQFVADWKPIFTILAICVVVTLLSEIASNVATATAMMPVTAALAVSIGVHPYFLMIPAVLAASSGFMLPVATAPNTIVFSTGLVRTSRMARSGVLLDVACALIITLLILTVIPRILGFDLLQPLVR